MPLETIYRGEVQMLQAPYRTAHDILRKSPRPSCCEQRLCLLVDEAPDHPVTPVNPANARPDTINNLFMTCKRMEQSHA